MILHKQLHAATDFGDEIIHNDRYYDQQHLDSLMRYLASIGVRRLEWIHHCWLALDASYPLGFDVEAEVVQAAHRHGLELVAIIKPFEILHYLLPHAFPIPASACWRGRRGLFTQISDLALARPDLCLKRRPGNWNPGGPVTAIRLVKNNSRPSGLTAEDLTVWTSAECGSWTRLDQPFRLDQSTEWRPLHPESKACRILTLGGLSIPESQRYIEVRTRCPDPQGDFINDVESIIELVDAGGAVLPQTAPGILSTHGRWIAFLKSPVVRQLFRHWNSPEVESLLLRQPALLEQWDSAMRDYGHKGYPSVPYDLNRIGRVAAVRGVDDVLPLPHPIYREVREYWLGKVRRFLDLGADGINFRHCMHFRQFDLHEYGFNAPVLERTAGSVNRAEVARVNGAAYTQLLREAATLTRSRGKVFGVHVSSEFLQRADENRWEPFVRNFEFPWESWVHEFCDFAEFRGAMGNRPETIRAMIDRIGLVCREAGKPLIYQGNRRAFAFDGPHPYHNQEMDWVLNHPDVAAYQFYETGSFSRINAKGELEGSPAVRDLARRHGFGA
jgi:hypothetical protein